MNIWKFAVPLCAFCLCLGCSDRGQGLTEAESERIRATVAQWADDLTQDLAARGPEAWLEQFLESPAFHMASDGILLFTDFDSAAVFIHEFAPSVASMHLVWRDVRIDPMAHGMATMSAAYDEVLTDTSGSSINFNGYFTGLAVETPEGWKFQSMHWSSPASTE